MRRNYFTLTLSHCKVQALDQTRSTKAAWNNNDHWIESVIVSCNVAVVDVAGAIAIARDNTTDDD